MNENLNLVEILKNVPIGTKLYSPICGECELYQIILPNSKCPWIECKICGEHDSALYFSSDGRFCDYENGECMLFPSKINKDWSTFGIDDGKIMPYEGNEDKLGK